MAKQHGRRIVPAATYDRVILALSPHLIGWLVLPQSHVNRVPQEVVGRPGQVRDLGDKLRLDPVHPRKDERRSEAGLT
jgi:hypothetical protein